MPRDTGAEQAYWRLRDMILRTELKPGSALVEADLVERTGFSRTPIRDALHRLVHEGLVEIIPRRGTFVTPVTISDLQQIFEVRLGLEEMVAHMAVEYCAPEDLATLRDLLARQRAAGDDEDTGVRLDGALHGLLVRMSRNHYLAEIYRRLSDASLRLLYLTRCGMETKTEQAAFFSAVDRALARRDGDGLAEALRTHIHEFRARVGGSIISGSFRLPERGRVPARSARRARSA